MFDIIVNFIIQKLKNKHTFPKKYTNLAKLSSLILSEQEEIKNQIFRIQVTELKEAFEKIDDFYKILQNFSITTEKLLDKWEEVFDNVSPKLFVMIAMADTNGDGMINFEEFFEMMVKG